MTLFILRRIVIEIETLKKKKKNHNRDLKADEKLVTEKI